MLPARIFTLLFCFCPLCCAGVRRPALRLMAAALLAVLPAAPAAAKGAAAEPVQFIAYRAVYEITLENMAEKSDLSGLIGRMVYQFSGSPCEGWTTQFRLLTHMDMKDDSSRLSDRQSSSFEADDGREFRFAAKNYTDGDLTEETAGAARRGKNGLEVVMSKPDDSIYKLPKADFPLMQMRDIVKNAMAGRHFIRMSLYDGASEADSVADSSVIIGAPKMPAADDREVKFLGPFAAEPAWPVTIAYYDDSDNKDGLPSFRTQFLLYKNGISRDLFMDYGDFSVRGKLVQLDILDNAGRKTACKK